MASYNDKRRHERYTHACPMVLYRTDDQNQSCKVVMKDYSRYGMAFYSDDALIPGQKVYVGINQYDPKSSGPEKYRGYDGYVKWTRPYASPDQDYPYSHMNGIEYYQAYY